MRRIRRSVTAACTLFALTGCLSARATRCPYFLAEDAARAAAGQRWGLMPASAAAPLPDYLAAPAQRVESALCARIASAGPACRELSPEELPAPGAAPGELAPATGLDALVLPELVTREVEILPGGWVVWDGVKRRTRVVREEGAPLGTYQMAGRALALSLRVRVFGRDGSRLFESCAGLDLLEEARVDARSYRKQVRPDLLADPALVREAVEEALRPLISR